MIVFNGAWFINKEHKAIFGEDIVNIRELYKKNGRLAKTCRSFII